jgi:hypothetical protein
LAILFPIISLSDDLHELPATLEEASPFVLATKKCVVNHSSNHHWTLDRMPLILPSFETNDQRADCGFVAPQQPARSSPAHLLAEIGRSPPSLAIDQIS